MKVRRGIIAVLMVVGFAAHGASAVDHELVGSASWYAGKFQGRLTANGEVFDTMELTAAHKTLPFDTIVRVRRTDTGAFVVVRINDRGPFIEGRIIDLSRAAAELIGLVRDGVAPVELELLRVPEVSTEVIVQVASYASVANAEVLAARLREAGLDAEVEAVEGRALHRVAIVLADEQPLAATLETLARLGIDTPLVRRPR